MKRFGRLQIDDLGFTLVDLLVGLAIFALLGIILTQALMHSTLSIQSAQHATGQASLANVRLALDNLLSETRPNIDGADIAITGPPLKGTKDAIGFVTGYASSGQFGGVYASIIHVVRTPNGDFKDLVLDQRLLRRTSTSSEVATNSQRLLLLPHVGEVTFSYCGGRNAILQIDCRQTWEEARLPSWIKIAISFPQGDSRSWANQYVELALAN